MQLLRALGIAVVAGLTLGCGLGQAAVPLPTDSWRLCPQAIATEERSNSIPKHLLSAIALAESARTHPDTGKRMPWPWTVMAEGQGRYLPTKAAAISEVRNLQARGIRNIDVGCMQVNLYHHADAFASLDEAFDPASNVAYAARFLRSLFEDEGSWRDAAGRYHSATPELKIPYQNKVAALWNDQQRRERSGGTDLETGPLTAGLGTDSTIQSRVRSPALMFSLADRRMIGGTRMPVMPRLARSLPGAPSAPSAPEPPVSGIQRAPLGMTGRYVRSHDEEAAFAARRVQYLQELRQAVAEVKRSYSVQVARDDPR
ncbi:MAG: lytic transglycosylase domain-containing protein [Rhodospirillales bacterium]|nr:lytic transglycosylase domain-containing protein [Rhodospirillales bacterium]